jgi:hypothetical protein
VNNRLLAQSGYAKVNNVVDTKWRNRPIPDVPRSCKTENRYDFYSRMESFLSENLS